MISSRVFAAALRTQAPAVKARPAARIFQQTRGLRLQSTPKLREPIPVRLVMLN